MHGKNQFRTSLRKDSVPNYPSIWTLFSTSVTGPDVLCNALTFPRSVCRWRHKIRKIAVEILQSVNNGTHSLPEILRIVIIDIVINTLLGRLTLDPASMHCPAWDDAFVSSYCCAVLLLDQPSFDDIGLAASIVRQVDIPSLSHCHRRVQLS